MPTSPFFSKYSKQEKLFLEDILTESIRIQGEDVFYLPRQYQRFDPVFGEDVLSKFDVALPIEIYIESFSGYGGQQEILSKFGMEINDQLNIKISRRAFKYSVGRYGNGKFTNERPSEGDLIYIPLSQQLFEIRFCDNDSPFYQLGQVPLYNVVLETYQYNNEVINTGINDIDLISELNSIDRLSFNIELEDGGKLLTETGGVFILDDFDNSSKTADDTLNFSDQQNSLNIINFDEDDPFNEKFN